MIDHLLKGDPGRHRLPGVGDKTIRVPSATNGLIDLALRHKVKTVEITAARALSSRVDEERRVEDAIRHHLRASGHPPITVSTNRTPRLTSPTRQPT